MNPYKSNLYLDSLKLVETQKFDDKTIVVTGSTGMIGSCLIDILSLWNHTESVFCKIVAIGRDLTKAKERFDYCWNDPFFSFIEQDICKPLHGFPEHVDYIIHAAGNADPVNFSKSPIETLLANVIGTSQLLEYGKQHGMKRFLYVSSGEMYGQPNAASDAFVENYCGPVDHSNSRACYPAGKRAAEVLCQSYISQYQTDVVIARPCHIFGPTMTRGDSRAVSEFLWSAVEQKDIILKSAGLLERSHCYVIDAVSAVLKILDKGECGKAYNIADSKYQMTIRDFAQQAALAGGCKVVFENPSDVEVRGYSTVSRAVLDASRLEKLGWKAQEDKTSSIVTTVEILREIRNGA